MTVSIPASPGLVNTLAVQPNGQIIIGGTFSSLQPNGVATPVTRGNAARLNADGSLDSTFDPEANGPVLAAVVQPNGQIVIGGLFTSVQPNGGAAVTRNFLARFNADGTLDATFNPNPSGNITGEVTALAMEPNGQILVGGAFTAMQPNGGSSVSVARLARLNQDGTVDTTFKPTPSAQVDAIVVQPNGQILIGGGFQNLQPNGATTPTLIAYLARLNTDGSVDASFNAEPNNQVASIALQPNGQIIIGGYFTSLNPNASSNFTPATATASIAQPQNVVTAVTITYGGSGYVTTPTITLSGGNQLTDVNATAVAVLTNGVITAINITNQGSDYTGAPNVTITPPNPANYIARLNSDGSADMTFTPQAAAGVNAVAVQPDGKILVGGTIGDVTYNGVSTFISHYLLRLNADGTPDSNFTPQPNYVVNAIAVAVRRGDPDRRRILPGQGRQHPVLLLPRRRGPAPAHRRARLGFQSQRARRDRCGGCAGQRAGSGRRLLLQHRRSDGEQFRPPQHRRLGRHDLQSQPQRPGDLDRDPEQRPDRDRRRLHPRGIHVLVLHRPGQDRRLGRHFLQSVRQRPGQRHRDRFQRPDHHRRPRLLPQFHLSHRHLRPESRPLEPQRLGRHDLGAQSQRAGLRHSLRALGQRGHHRRRLHRRHSGLGPADQRRQLHRPDRPE